LPRYIGIALFQTSKMIKFVIISDTRYMFHSVDRQCFEKNVLKNLQIFYI